ncbi:D(1) dopamine receptor [Trichoplax sp. H2]|nr:D(1) dopamine receptor [Trichoplax sp. H2]|eukprot:RDD38287.1 D(1) dopamine receptor [Trichoplax sp. H2]
MSNITNKTTPTIEMLLSNDLGLIIFMEILGFITLVTNSVLAYLILSRRRLRAINHNSIIASMCFGCIIFAIFYCLLYPFNIISKASVNIFCPLFGPFRNFCLVILNLHLCLVGIEKYLLITYPLTVKLTRKTVLIIVTGIWISGFTISFLPIFTYRPYNPKIFNGCVRIAYNQINKEIAYFIIFQIIIFVVPLMIMLYCYGYISILAFRHIRNIDRNYYVSNEVNNDVRLRKKNIRAAKPFIVMVGTFLLTWLPTIIFNTMVLIIPSTIGQNNSFMRNFVASLNTFNVQVLRSIAFSYCAVNPLIYGYFNPEIRRAFYLFLGCKAAAANIANPTSYAYSINQA